jgi:hypothetical protein
MTVAAPSGLPGVTTRATRTRLSGKSGVKPVEVVAHALGEPSKTPANKRLRVEAGTPSTAAPLPTNMAFEQWLDDVSNVDISLSIRVERCYGSEHTNPGPEPIESRGEDLIQQESATAGFRVSIPTMLTRVLQSKLAIDSARLQTNVSPSMDGPESSEIFLGITVRGREEPIAEAIAGGLTPRKAFLRTAPHISRVASRLQDCMRQIFGMKDFVVKVD